MSLPDSCERKIQDLVSLDPCFQDDQDLLETWLQIRAVLIIVFAENVTSPSRAQVLFESWYIQNSALLNAAYYGGTVSTDQRAWLSQFLDNFQGLREEVVRLFKPKQRVLSNAELYLAHCFYLTQEDIGILSRLPLLGDEVAFVFEFVHSVKFYSDEVAKRRWHPNSDSIFEQTWRDFSFTFERKNGSGVRLIRAERASSLEIPYLSPDIS